MWKLLESLVALFKNNNHSTQNLALLCEQAVFIECMVTWEQVCWLGSPVGPDQGYVSEIEILRPPVSESPVVLAKLQTPGRLPTLSQTICEQTLEPIFFPERVYHTKSWELMLVFSCQCLMATLAFQEHWKSLPICPMLSSLLLQPQIDWLRFLVGLCGHEPSLNRSCKQN